MLGCSSPVPTEEVVLIVDGVDDLGFAADRWLSRDQTWSRTRQLRHFVNDNTRGNLSLLSPHIVTHCVTSRCPHVRQGRLQEIHVASGPAREGRRRRPRQRRTIYSEHAHHPRVEAQAKGKAHTAEVPTQLWHR